MQTWPTEIEARLRLATEQAKFHTAGIWEIGGINGWQIVLGGPWYL